MTFNTLTIVTDFFDVKKQMMSVSQIFFCFHNFSDENLQASFFSVT